MVISAKKTITQMVHSEHRSGWWNPGPPLSQLALVTGSPFRLCVQGATPTPPPTHKVTDQRVKTTTSPQPPTSGPNLQMLLVTGKVSSCVSVQKPFIEPLKCPVEAQCGTEDENARLPPSALSRSRDKWLPEFVKARSPLSLITLQCSRSAEGSATIKEFCSLSTGKLNLLL